MIPGAELHRSAVLDEVTGGLLRPGGLGLTEYALRQCSLPPGARVLDVGCGVGTTVEHLRRTLGFAALGIDLDGQLLAKAAERWGALPLISGAGTQLPLRDGSMEAVLLECTFSLVPDTAALLRECRRVLVPRGSLVVTDLFARRSAGLEQARRASPACGRGLRLLTDFTEALEENGFSLRIFEDRSTALAELMARLIFSDGGAASFWSLACAHDTEPAEAARALRAARPGYLLLVAERTDDGGST